jgi:amidase
MDAMLAGEPWMYDAITVPLPWRKELAEKPTSRPLRIGYYYDDGYVRVQPPMELGVRKAVEALTAAGHDGRTSHSGFGSSDADVHM